jgi:hypothetical protein
VKLPTHEELDAARRVGDPPADATVAALGRDAWIVNAALRHVRRSEDPLPEAVPPVVRRFFAEHVAPPPWLDEGRVRRAQAWASRHLVLVTVALFCGSLPAAYGAARGARVLAATGRMRGPELDRRVNETARFVLDVVAEGGIAGGGPALRAIQKVRLAHAAVRAHLLGIGAGDGEVPINQEDMLGTLFTFSVVVVRSLRLLGVAVDDEEADDYYHLWRGVGAMMGIREELLPPSFSSASAVADRIAARQIAGSEHGRALMASLLAGMERHLPGLRFLPRHLVRYLVGDRLADQLGVPPDGAFQAKLSLLRLLPRLPGGPLATLAEHAAPLVGRPLLEAIVAAKLGGKPATFAMPDPS